MFCLLKFNNVDTDETQQLMHELSGNPKNKLKRQFKTLDS